jgi:cytochrome c-type biogenesis protein
MAGILSFLSPCILPLVPFYLVYLTGSSITALREDDGNGLTRNQLARGGLALAFAAGVVTVFALLGLGASTLGRLFADWQRELSLLAAGLLAVFAGHFLGLWRLGWLDRSAGMAGRAQGGSVAANYGLGLAFGFGWTPCVGPVLAGILMLAGGMDDPLRGAVLLVTYGAGMTLPFVAAAVLAGPFLRTLAVRPALLARMERVTGVALLVLAGLIATDTMAVLAFALLETFPVFQHLG